MENYSPEQYIIAEMLATDILAYEKCAPSIYNLMNGNEKDVYDKLFTDLIKEIQRQDYCQEWTDDTVYHKKCLEFCNKIYSDSLKDMDIYFGNYLSSYALNYVIENFSIMKKLIEHHLYDCELFNYNIIEYDISEYDIVMTLKYKPLET